ncbi:MAG: hypothetical protein WD750_05870 [Gammaproteobacteria bacterium]
MRPAWERDIGDPILDRWCAIYHANPSLRVRGLTLEQFLYDPEKRLQETVFNHVQPGGGTDFRPLLPRQLAVLHDLAEEEAGQLSPDALAAYLDELEAQLVPEPDCRLKAGAWVQPLHHHRYDESHDRDHRRIKR